ncbi:hypothetical protein RirG_031460 [Rhizophagus irregularis DAOM 197198w]|uniref:Uncharacterized protein n=1 Tax=Rhizophagus irregularis (strain DAOM 197198w) TaxID=1432141 RepID=A0A015K4D5_RHIIW|nr:hypothetical protein RirG_031460 [Rhizophagus irregularis DAOM 197198w]
MPRLTTPSPSLKLSQTHNTTTSISAVAPRLISRRHFYAAPSGAGPPFRTAPFISASTRLQALDSALVLFSLYASSARTSISSSTSNQFRGLFVSSPGILCFSMPYPCVGCPISAPTDHCLGCMAAGNNSAVLSLVEPASKHGCPQSFASANETMAADDT